MISGGILRERFLEKITYIDENLAAEIEVATFENSIVEVAAWLWSVEWKSSDECRGAAIEEERERENSVGWCVIREKERGGGAGWRNCRRKERGGRSAGLFCIFNSIFIY